LRASVLDTIRHDSPYAPLLFFLYGRRRSFYAISRFAAADAAYARARVVDLRYAPVMMRHACRAMLMMPRCRHAIYGYF